MPVDRNGRVPNRNGETTMVDPGAYEHVLRQICEREAGHRTTVRYHPLLDDDPSLAAEHEREVAELTAVVMAERAGQPVSCVSWQLPQGLPAPFEGFPVGGQRCFVVKADDTITLVAREARSA
jgi:hypothetical protein